MRKKDKWLSHLEINHSYFNRVLEPNDNYYNKRVEKVFFPYDLEMAQLKWELKNKKKEIH